MLLGVRKRWNLCVGVKGEVPFIPEINIWKKQLVSKRTVQEHSRTGVDATI